MTKEVVNRSIPVQDQFDFDHSCPRLGEPRPAIVCEEDIELHFAERQRRGLLVFLDVLGLPDIRFPVWAHRLHQSRAVPSCLSPDWAALYTIPVFKDVDTTIAVHREDGFPRICFQTIQKGVVFMVPANADQITIWSGDNTALSFGILGR